MFFTFIRKFLPLPKEISVKNIKINLIYFVVFGQDEVSGQTYCNQTK